jgi:hypothetical protein
MKQKPLTLKIWERNEMAELVQGKESLHLGNFWDFHAGCMGTEFIFEDGSKHDFEKEWTDEIRTPEAVAEMVASYLDTTFKIKRYPTKWKE